MVADKLPSSPRQVVDEISRMVAESLGHRIGYTEFGSQAVDGVVVYCTAWRGTRVKHEAWIVSVQVFLGSLAPQIDVQGHWLGDVPFEPLSFDDPSFRV